MTRYLKKKSDGRSVIPVQDLLIWTPVLSDHPGLEEYSDPTNGAQSDGIADEAHVDDLLDDGGLPDANKILVLVEAIGSLKPEDFTKGTLLSKPKPRVEALEIIVGFEVSADDRDLAWEEFQRSKG